MLNTEITIVTSFSEQKFPQALFLLFKNVPYPFFQKQLNISVAFRPSD